MSMKTGYVAGITRGHNAGVCLLYEGEIVFHVEEERLTRRKYDGGPLASITKILDYTDKVDYVVIAHTQPLHQIDGGVCYSGEDIYTSLFRKLGLIDDLEMTKKHDGYRGHPQVVDLSTMHHKLHAAAAFYRSGFDTAASVIIDGAGTFTPMSAREFGRPDPAGNMPTVITYETESIFDCAYPAKFKTLFKHSGVIENILNSSFDMKMPIHPMVESEEDIFTLMVTDRAGIVKTYEAVTEYCGFSAIEAGKTMGLFPYGKPKEEIARPIFKEHKVLGPYKEKVLLADREMFSPAYPATGVFQNNFYPGYTWFEENEEWTNDTRYAHDKEPNMYDAQCAKDMAYKIQKETEQAAVWWIRKAYEMTGNKNIVISGGYGLNCVANYHYLEELKDLDLNIYVEPISSDAGTCIGAALMFWRYQTEDKKKFPESRLYLGPKYDVDEEKIKELIEHDPAIEMSSASKADVVDVITSKNIVAVFQGRSESGPRALGNRSILYDPTDPDAKDFVNTVKKREFFRPFAGSILLEDAHDWFDMRGLKESPDMMYAMQAQPGKAEIIPGIIHEDGSCRIQTVKEADNYHYYHLIKEFKKKTGCPIIFNTSFNLGGEPLVETIQDAIRTIRDSEIEYLYLPELDILLYAKNPKLAELHSNTFLTKEELNSKGKFKP